METETSDHPRLIGSGHHRLRIEFGARRSDSFIAAIGERNGRRNDFPLAKRQSGIVLLLYEWMEAAERCLVHRRTWNESTNRKRNGHKSRPKSHQILHLTPSSHSEFLPSHRRPHLTDPENPQIEKCVLGRPAAMRPTFLLSTLIRRQQRLPKFGIAHWLQSEMRSFFKK